MDAIGSPGTAAAGAENAAVDAPQHAEGTKAPPSPARAVLAIRQFRCYWTAQFLSSLCNGSLRFVFVWLVLDISDSDVSAGAVGVGLGLPALIVSLPAGSLADRVDRRRLIIIGELVAAAVLGIAASTVWSGAMTVPLAVVFALVTGAVLAGVAPALQAMVPSLVPPEHLLTGVALQTMGLNASLLIGAMLGGAAIAVAGVGGAFAMLGTMQLLSAVAMLPVRVDQHRVRAAATRGSTTEGLRFALQVEPVRTLLALGLLVGIAWGIVTVLLPQVSQDVLGQGALATSMLFSVLAVGMLTMSTTLAARRPLARPGRVVGISMTIGMGGGVIAAGLSRTYWLTLVIMLLWGISGGIASTLQRGLLQMHTPPELMGRLTAVNSLTMLGSFPLAAGLSAVLTATVGPANGLVITGVVTTVLASAVGVRRPLRQA